MALLSDRTLQLIPLAINYTWQYVSTSVRNSCPEELCKKGVLKNLGKFTEKNLCLSLFNKVADLQSTTLFKGTSSPVFSCKKIFKNFFKAPLEGCSVAEMSDLGHQ